MVRKFAILFFLLITPLTLSGCDTPQAPRVSTRTPSPTFKISSKATPAPKVSSPLPTTKAIQPPSNCHPSYTGACLDPNASDYDCIGGSGNGPKYTGKVYVVGPDVFGLDRDGDGIGCE